MSRGLNKVMIIGHLGRDPEMRYTPNGQAVCSFGVATNRRWKDQSGQQKDQVEFHNIVAWGRLAEIARQYLTKGQLIFVEGRIQTRSWQAPDGQKKYRTEIVAQNFQMGPRSGRNQEGGINAQASAPKTPAAEEIPIIEEDTPISFDEEKNNDEIKPEDIPF